MASYCPSSSFRSLVCTFPRISFTRISGLIFLICSSLLRLPVPTTLPGFKSFNKVPSLVTITSSTGPRLRTAPIPRPSGNSIGISLALCTARSICPCSRAASSSWVNTPFPPKERSERSKSSSPFVDISQISIFRSGNASNIIFSTIWVCTRASLLFLVPILIVFCI